MTDEAKSVLITGCSTGIGHETARHLADRGWRVYATARRPETLADLAEAGCETLPLDVTDEASMQAAVNAVTEAGGSIYGLVNNAGYSQSGAFETLPIEKFRTQIETNVVGLVRLTQLVLPAMRAQRWGKIVNVSSMGGKITWPGAAAYHASKHALEGLSDVLRFEVAGFGVDVIVVEPGLVRTRFAAAAVGSMDHVAETGPYAELDAAVARITTDAYRRGLANLIVGSPDDVARVIEKALNAKRPRPRYRVAGAGLLIAVRRLLGDRLSDALLRRIYPQPGR